MQPPALTTRHKPHHKLHAAFPKWMIPILVILRPGWYVTHKMAVDPRWQFCFNAFFAVFWLVVMWYVTKLPAFEGRSNLAGLLIMEVSLWANFISHYGALGANVAAIIASEANQRRLDLGKKFDI